jgi:glycosyltransferase involved in cell wall biosynthesis
MAIVEFLEKNYQIAKLEQPDLYIYGIHQQNTWHAEHFEVHWRSASTQYAGDNYHQLLQNLAKYFPINAYLASVARSINLPKLGINVAGFINEGFGISEGVKYCLSALKSQQIPYALHQINGQKLINCQHSINLLHANPDSILDPHQKVLSSLGDRYFQHKYNIGYWVWESLEYFPSQWLPAFNLFDEIWTPSDYARAALSRVSPIPVTTIPHSIELPASPQFNRQEVGLPVDKFIFLFIYDPLSLAVRKNPEGAITAFKKAFDRTDDRVRLIIKTKGINSQARAQLETLIDNYPQIEIIDEYFSRDRLNSLIYHCDCYVSLHRAEGFGLTLAEAMFYGKPTIATGFSGNLDFMNDRNSLLVNHHSVRLDSNFSYFGAGTIWAEPDLDCASQYMHQVIDLPELAKQIGDRASRDIRSQLSPQSVGMMIQDCLQKYELN